MTLILELPVFASACIVGGDHHRRSLRAMPDRQKVICFQNGRANARSGRVCDLSSFHASFVDLGAGFRTTTLQHDIRSTVTTEAILVGDIFWCLDRYGGDRARDARFHMTDYAETVVTEK